MTDAEQLALVILIGAVIVIVAMLLRAIRQDMRVVEAHRSERDARVTERQMRARVATHDAIAKVRSDPGEAERFIAEHRESDMWRRFARERAAQADVQAQFDTANALRNNARAGRPPVRIVVPRGRFSLPQDLGDVVYVAPSIIDVAWTPVTPSANDWAPSTSCSVPMVSYTDAPSTSCDTSSSSASE